MGPNYLNLLGVTSFNSVSNNREGPRKHLVMLRNPLSIYYHTHTTNLTVFKFHCKIIDDAFNLMCAIIAFFHLNVAIDL